MAGTRRIAPDSHGWATRRPAPCQSEDDVAPPAARDVLAARARRWPLAPVRARRRAARRTRAAPCAPTASPRRRRTTRRRATSACTTSPTPPTATSPALTSTRVAGVPDWVVSAGEAAEAAWARETALGFPAPPADDGDGAERGGDARYDIYVCDLAAPRRRRARRDRRRSARLGLQLRRGRQRLRPRPRSRRSRARASTSCA